MLGTQQSRHRKALTSSSKPPLHLHLPLASGFKPRSGACHCGQLSVNDAIKLTPTFCVHWVCFVYRRIGRIRVELGLAPLFEEEWNACIKADVAYGVNPPLLHRSRSGARFSTD